MSKQKMPAEPQETPEQKLQRKYVQVQLLRQYLNAMLEEKAKIDERVNELTLSAIAMRKLKELPKGQEMWSTLGSDVFVMSDIKSMEKVIVGVGSGVFVKKDIDDAIASLDGKKTELEKVINNIAQEALMLQAELQKLEPELQALVEKAQKEQEGQATGG